MTEITVESRATNPRIRLQSEALTVTVTPGKGSDITSIIHHPTGQETLWQSPWGGRPSGYALPESDSVDAWMQGFAGGWPVMVPNASSACIHRGIRHSFHGEASLAPWDWALDGEALTLRLAFYTLPLIMTRRLSIDGDLLLVEETLTNDGVEPVELIWGHHPSFGGALLDGPARLTSGARKVTADGNPDERGNAILSGHESDWPHTLDRDGKPLDLRTPLEGEHGMAYLHDFTEGWAGLTRTDGALGIALSWETTLFPTAWLWQEMGSSKGGPWFGRGRVVGIEPCTSWPGIGLAATVEQGRHLLTLAPGERRETALRLHVFTGLGEIAGIRDGRARGLAPGYTRG